MEEADEYVPQIAQIDYNICDANGQSRSYYNPMRDMYNHAAAQQQRGQSTYSNISGAGYLQPTSTPAAAPAPPKKRGGRKKATQPSTSQESNGQPTAYNNSMPVMYPPNYPPAMPCGMGASQSAYNPYYQAGKWPDYPPQAQQQQPPYRPPAQQQYAQQQQQQHPGYNMAPNPQGYYHPGMQHATQQQHQQQQQQQQQRHYYNQGPYMGYPNSMPGQPSQMTPGQQGGMSQPPNVPPGVAQPGLQPMQHGMPPGQPSMPAAQPGMSQMQPPGMPSAQPGQMNPMMPGQPGRYPMPPQGFYPDMNAYNMNYGYPASTQTSKPPLPTSQNSAAHSTSASHTTGPVYPVNSAKSGPAPQQQPQTKQFPVQQMQPQQAPSMHSNVFTNLPQQQVASLPKQQQQQQQQSQQAQQQQPHQGYYQQQSNLAMNMHMLQNNIMELERQLQYVMQQPVSPESTARRDQIQMRLTQLKAQQQSLASGFNASSQGRIGAQQQPVYPNCGNGVEQSAQSHSQLNPASMPTSMSQPHDVTPQMQNHALPTNSASSVSVMQTAANQVQVNITPEAAGRTLISVYHQYPPCNSTADAHPVVVKDSVPPEPVPSNESTQQPAHIPHIEKTPSSVPVSTSSAVPLGSTTLTSVAHSNTVLSAAVLSPIPPQPIPSPQVKTEVCSQPEATFESLTKTATNCAPPVKEQEVQQAQTAPALAVSKTIPAALEDERATAVDEKRENEEKKTEEPLSPNVEDGVENEKPSEVDCELETGKVQVSIREEVKSEEPFSDESVEVEEEFVKKASDLNVAQVYKEKEVVALAIEVPKKPKKVPTKTKRPSVSAGRKRKKASSEGSSDQDAEFVVDTKKRKSKCPNNNGLTQEVTPEIEMSPVDYVEKRRSGRTKQDRKYDEKMDFDDEFDDIFPSTSSVVESTTPPSGTAELVVEKILGMRTLTKEEIQEQKLRQSSEKSNVDESAENTEPASEESTKDAATSEDTTDQKSADSDDEENEMFYVKFKNKSYLHCEWKSIKELEVLDKRIISKINRFKAKYVEENEFFNPDFTIVDRVLDESSGDDEMTYLVKWKSQQYEEATWETADVVPEVKIDEYRKRKQVDQARQKEVVRPEASAWENSEKVTSVKEYKDGNTLRDYQVEGVNWLLFCYYNRQNCILADEMGLGKTVQTITFLQGVYDMGIHGPFLVVVPLSTLPNWEREFETWTNLNTVVYYGSATSRDMIQNYEMYYGRIDSKKKMVPKFDVLLTTFEMIISDVEVLRKVSYRVCVIDEAHRLKNRNSKLLTGGLLSFKLDHRVLLTGTPLQNNIQELFSLLNFLEPEQFHSSESFLEQFGQCQTEEQVQQLQAILKPMMLRRLKEDVEKSLQPKEETIIEVQLSNIQKKYYRAILERNFTHLLKGTTPSLINTMMELRKCCNHPFLIKGAEDQIVAELKPFHPDKSDDELYMFASLQSSGKLVLIEKLLPKLKQDGHKVLIFSQMVKVLDLIEEFLSHMNYSYERIDGNIRGDLRQAAIDRFSRKDSDRFVFLLCTRAGGLGINLTAADTVIIFDSDWNPQNDLQAQARCHRIGQTKMVKVYRLITANTYEREMFDKASLKLGLDKAVLQSMTPKENNAQLTRKEVEDLLRKGAYGAVMDEDSEGSKFSEEDIDTILSRRTQTIRLEPGVKGSTFAKASFTSSSNREDIDVNDPNFWAKWAKKANVDVDAGKNELILSEPRSRRKRFEENYKGLHEGESDADEGSDGRASADFSKNRSGKKRRRGDDDDDYVNYTPDELAFNKSEYFKVEKLLNIWGWGRWKEIKEHSDLNFSLNDIEHIARTLLLHCIREYRGDEKTKDFVYHLIAPEGAVSVKPERKNGTALYNDGWARMPEYNPPSFAIDVSFTRHIHRHANKLLQRMFHLFLLHNHLIAKAEADKIMADKDYTDVNITVPSVGDPPLPNWTDECDKCFIIGIYKHGMENYDTIRSDEKLVFIKAEIEEMPSTMELNTRFKRIMMLVSRQLEMTLSGSQSQQEQSAKWPKAEAAEFMAILRIYGVKDDHEGHNVINWNRFREMSTTLHNKTDAEMLEQLYCVLAMCTKEQGGELSAVDQRRASVVDKIPAKKAEKLMNRLHLMRKIHAIVTTGVHKVRTSLKLCNAETMCSGWGEVHDEQLLIVVDKYGLDKIAQRLSKLSQFNKIASHLDEGSLVRRVVEICTTLETGKWNGKGSVDLIDDENISTSDLSSLNMLSSDAQAMAILQKIMGVSTSGQNLSQRSQSGQKKPALKKKTSTGSSSATAAQLSSLADMNYLMSLFGGGSGSSASSSAAAQQLQQVNALATMYALMAPMMGNDASSKQAMNILMSLMGNESLNLTGQSAASSHKPSTTAASTTAATKSTASTTSSSAPSASAPSTSALPASSKAQDAAPQMSVADVLKCLNLPNDTSIPVVKMESGEKLSGSKAPTLGTLETWLAAHPDWKVDSDALMGSVTTVEPKRSQPPADPPKPVVKKEDPAIGVFNRSNGVVLAKEKWPKLSELTTWLEKHPEMNVQDSFVATVKHTVPSSLQKRLGNEQAAQLSNNQAAALSALEQSLLQSMGMSNAQNVENMQMQLLLQQLMLGSSPMSGLYHNPYAQLMSQSGLGIPSSSGTNEAALLSAMFGSMVPQSTASAKLGSAGSAASANSQQNINDLLTAELISNPALLNSLMTPTSTAAGLSGLASVPGLVNMDLNMALQMSMLSGALGQTSTNNSLSTAASTPATSVKPKTTPAQTTSRGSGKLNALVEKLASSSSQNSTNGDK